MKECIRKWLEPLGLILLLVAFGWQCLAEHSKQVKYEGYIYEMSQKLDAIWLGVYASTFPHCSMKSSEYLWPKTKRLVKDERRSKSKLRVCA